MEIAKLQQSVGWLWKLTIGIVVLGGTAILSSFLILDDRIQDRFDVADSRNREIAKDIGEMKADVAKQSVGIDQILRTISSDNAQGSPREGQNGPVHQGKGS